MDENKSDVPWWRREGPLVLAVVGAILTISGNMVVGYFNNAASLQQEKHKAENDLALEVTKAKYNLILQAIATNDIHTAQRNINFFVQAGLLDDPHGKIRDALAQFNPVLPSLSGNSPQGPQALPVPEIERLYNFPKGLDGRGQTIGILELEGGFRQEDVDAYFNSLNMSAPAIVPVPIEGSENRPGNPLSDTQVLADLEITGGIAPRSTIRVYFAPSSPEGWVKAIKRATADRVSVLLIGWGQPEKAWKKLEIDTINSVLEAGAKSGITIICAVGERGVTAGLYDGRRHVGFPSSSPWVLSVGGTSLRGAGNKIESEIVWNEKTMGATGGGISDYFDRPEWQDAALMPPGTGGHDGRGIPDVVATASSTLAKVMVSGRTVPIGGTSVSAAIWTGLIALINQRLGRNIGYLTPRLYREIGPGRVLRPITDGNNSVDSVEGYAAGPGWSPVAGWGSPDGERLLEWLTYH